MLGARFIALALIGLQSIFPTEAGDELHVKVGVSNKGQESKDHGAFRNLNTDCKEKCVCDRDYSPVCGTDGKTYGNGCEMECESCEQGTDVTVASQGECTEARSRLSNICPCGCPNLLGLVCGTDGKTYDNECLMECENCKQGTDVTVASQGECPKEKDCKEKMCPCPAIWAPVCGTDGKTYASKCVMECENCEPDTDVTVASQGECPKEKVCPMCGCHLYYAPVCGTDGKTYSNECLMECKSCKQDTNVTVASYGECPKDQDGA